MDTGKSPVCLGQREQEALANQETQHLLGKYELVLKRAVIERFLKSNLVLFPQRRSSKKTEAIHFYSAAPDVQLLPSVPAAPFSGH